MTTLIELGATQLIEMGSPRYMGSTLGERPSPVLDLFKVVNFIEDPFQGFDLEHGESISPKQRAVAERLRTVSRLTRKTLAGNYGLGAVDLMAEATFLSQELNELGNIAIGLGKFRIGKAFKKIGKKIGKVVKSPAFLSVVGVVANVIPGVGQVASVALLTTAGIMAKKQQEAKQKKAMQKAEKQAAADAAAADLAQIDAYYQQNGPTWLFPLGYTPDVWAKLDLAKKRAILQQLVDGTLQPYGAPPAAVAPVAPVAPPDPAIAAAAQAEATRAAALSIAMKKEYGNQLPGSGIDVATLPPQMQRDAQALAPQYEKEIEVAGKDNFLATAKKAAGQAAAVEDIFSAAGVKMPGGELFSKLDDPKLLAAGQQDMKNTAAAAGNIGLMDKIFGGGGFPIIPVAIGTVVVGGVLYFVLRPS